jgi:hypothetical protein
VKATEQQRRDEAWRLTQIDEQIAEQMRVNSGGIGNVFSLQRKGDIYLDHYLALANRSPPDPLDYACAALALACWHLSAQPQDKAVDAVIPIIKAFALEQRAVPDDVKAAWVRHCKCRDRVGDRDLLDAFMGTTP